MGFSVSSGTWRLVDLFTVLDVNVRLIVCLCHIDPKNANMPATSKYILWAIGKVPELSSASIYWTFFCTSCVLNHNYSKSQKLTEQEWHQKCTDCVRWRSCNRWCGVTCPLPILSQISLPELGQHEHLEALPGSPWPLQQVIQRRGASQDTEKGSQPAAHCTSSHVSSSTEWRNHAVRARL